jgi:hypothetical protein
MAKGVVEFVKALNNAELTKQISDLTLQIAQNQFEAADMINENQALKAKIEELKTNPLHYDGTVYRDKDNFSYCPACFDAFEKKVHLKNPDKISRRFTCPVCKAYFFDK